MSNLSDFFGGSQIASIQRGTIYISGLNTNSTATISSVDTTKSVVNFLGYEGNGDAIRIQLTNATTITAERGATGSGNSVGFEVIEYV